MYTSSFYNLTLLHCPTSSSITSLLNSKSSGGNKGGEYQHFEVFFGSSVFTSTNTDKKWRDRRKNLVHAAFSSSPLSKLDSLIDVIWEHHSPSLKGKVRSLDFFQSFTLDLMTLYLTGLTPSEIPNANPKHFLSSSNRLRTSLLQAARDPLYRLLPSKLYFTLTTLGRSIKSDSCVCRQYALSLSSSSLPSTPCSFLPPSSYGLHELTTLLFAGTDTSSASLAWLVCDILPSDQSTAVKDAEAREKMVKESARLHPPAPFVVRDVRRGEIVDGVGIERDVKAVCWINAAGRDTEIFGHDAGQYRWERWEEFGDHAPNLLAFASGKRGCVGQGVGRRVVRRVFDRMVEGKRWRKVGGREIEEGGGFTDTPERGGEAFFEDR